MPYILKTGLGNGKSTKTLGGKYLYNPLQNVKEKEIPNVKNSYK